MVPGDTARLYHRLSSYAGDPDDEWPTPIDHPLVRQDFAPNHRPTFPAHHKLYPDSLPSVELPAAWPLVRAPTIDILAGRHTPVARPLDLDGLARLLHLSAGVVRVAVRRDGRRFLFRPAGSAGGLFPLELYGPHTASPVCGMASIGMTRRDIRFARSLTRRPAKQRPS